MNRRLIATIVLIATVVPATAISVPDESNFFAFDRKPETMREALQDPAGARALLVNPAFDDSRWTDDQIITSALGMHSKVVRRLPLVSKWEVGWIDTDGTFTADPNHDLVDSLGWFSKARPLGTVIVDQIDSGHPLPLPGDVNGDGIVDELDLTIILDNFGLTDRDLTREDGDLNGDGIVDTWDLLAVLEGFSIFE